MDNKSTSSDFLRVLLALENKTMKDVSVADVVQVTSVSGDNILCKSLTTGNTLSCLKLKDLIVAANDFALVIFTDKDFRSNLKNAKNNLYYSIDDCERHQQSYGIIIGLL